jgi:hypothetical protein
MGCKLSFAIITIGDVQSASHFYPSQLLAEAHFLESTPEHALKWRSSVSKFTATPRAQALDV